MVVNNVQKKANTVHVKHEKTSSKRIQAKMWSRNVKYKEASSKLAACSRQEYDPHTLPKVATETADNQTRHNMQQENKTNALKATIAIRNAVKHR